MMHWRQNQSNLIGDSLVRDGDSVRDGDRRGGGGSCTHTRMQGRVVRHAV